MGFWGGVWLLGALFMVTFLPVKPFTLIFKPGGFDCFNFQVVLMAKNYCCNTESMAKEDI